MTTFDALLHPLSSIDFLQKHFGRSATTFKPQHALQAGPEWQGAEWQTLGALRHVDAATRDAAGQHEQTRISSDQIAPSLASGATICADITQHPPVRDWLAAMSSGLGVGTGGFAKLYVSPAGAGFPMHFDPHHVFVLQCRGSKRWRYGALPALPNAPENAKVDARGEAVFSGRYEGLPIRGPHGALVAPLESELEEVVLAPGDALYLPPGTWHSASAQEESVAISLSPPRVHGFELLSRYLESRALIHSAWRSDLSITKTPIAGHAPPSVVEGLRQTAQEMADALTQLDFELLARQWMAQASALTAPNVELAVGKDTRLELSGPFPYLEASDGGSFVFYAAGEELSLPIEARPFIETLATTPPFCARDVLDWDANLRWRDAKLLLEQLARAGLLRVV